jgi:hypothetical protein
MAVAVLFGERNRRFEPILLQKSVEVVCDP